MRKLAANHPPPESPEVEFRDRYPDWLLVPSFKTGLMEFDVRKRQVMLNRRLQKADPDLLMACLLALFDLGKVGDHCTKITEEDTEAAHRLACERLRRPTA